MEAAAFSSATDYTFENMRPAYALTSPESVDFSDTPEQQLSPGEMITREILSSRKYKRELDKAIARIRRGKLIARPKRPR